MEDWERRQTATRTKERTLIDRKTPKEESKKGKRRVYAIVEENRGEESGLPDITNINKIRRGNSNSMRGEGVCTVEGAQTEGEEGVFMK